MNKLSLVFAVTLLLTSSSLRAQDVPEVSPEASQMASEISNEIFSPFCPGKTLAMCPSPDAAKVRRQIQQLADDGRSKDQIKETIIEEYGEEFRLVEPPSGDTFGLRGGIAVGLLLAVFAVVMLSRRRDADVQSSTPEDVPDEPAEESEDEAYLDEIRKEYRS